MKTDRELLELAAKAIGGRGKIAGKHYTIEGGLCCVNDLYWNPLTDDGDALRLAVKLNIGIIPDPRFYMVHADPIDRVLDSISQDYEGGDPYAATRRAIVRAAAAIGEAL